LTEPATQLRNSLRAYTIRLSHKSVCGDASVLMLCRPINALFACLLALLACASTLLAEPEARIVITDFTLANGAQSLLTGDIAASLLEERLSTWRHVEVVPRSQLLKEVAVRNITPPITPDTMVQLTKALEATHFITGQMTYAKVWADGRRARVEVQIEMIDASLSLPVNGAKVEAEAVAAEAAPLAVQMRALHSAVWEAAREMEQRTRISGKILAITGFNEIILDIGSQSGVRKGTRFVVTRREFDKELQQHTTSIVGEIRVTGVALTDATAVQTVRYRAVQPLDKIASIFDMSACKRTRIRE